MYNTLVSYFYYGCVARNRPMLLSFFVHYLPTWTSHVGTNGSTDFAMIPTTRWTKAS